jgi:hypothetical protein
MAFIYVKRSPNLPSILKMTAAKPRFAQLLSKDYLRTSLASPQEVTFGIFRLCCACRVFIPATRKQLLPHLFAAERLDLLVLGTSLEPG